MGKAGAKDKKKPRPVKKKKGAGRPVKYDPALIPQLAKWMRRSGLTDIQIAKELGVNKTTIYAWKKRYEEFSNSLKESKDFVDSLVEDSLLKRAIGYNYEEVKIIGKKMENGETETIRVEKTKKTVIPDTTAQIFWLKNRQPAKWRDKDRLFGDDVEAPKPISVTIQVDDARKPAPAPTN